MIDAAAFAAAIAADEILSAASASNAAITRALRWAIAAARNRPYFVCVPTVSSAAIDDRLSLTSLAKSGIPSVNVWIDMGNESLLRQALLKSADVRHRRAIFQGWK